jgi:hypothetical protein
MPRPSHSFLFHHPHNIGWWVQIRFTTFNLKLRGNTTHKDRVYMTAQLRQLPLNGQSSEVREFARL